MGKVKTAAGAGSGKGAKNADNAPGGKGDGKAGGSGKGGKGKKPKKEKLECGEDGEYGELQKKTGDNQFDRDHVPSKAALKEYTRREIAGGDELCGAQKTAIDKIGAAIAIPKWLHQAYSRTYGSLNSESRIGTDSTNLRAAARRDVAEIKKGLKDKRMSKECRKKYREWADKVTKTTNKQYHEMLKKAAGK